MLPALKAVGRDLATGQLRPTHAGILMFGLDPQLPLPQSEVVCISMLTHWACDAIHRPEELSRGRCRSSSIRPVAFSRSTPGWAPRFCGFYREDEPEYPAEALREAIVNAIIHRDYSRGGETVRVFLFPDRVEVRSPGGLPPELAFTVDDLLTFQTASVPRNEVLAGFLRDIPGYMERVGSGIRFMVTEMRAMGFPDPEFTDHLDFIVTFRNGQPIDEQRELNPRQVIGLQLARTQGSISTPEYCVATGATDRMGLRDLQDLVAKGVLVVRGKKKGMRFYLA